MVPAPTTTPPPMTWVPAPWTTLPRLRFADVNYTASYMVGHRTHAGWPCGWSARPCGWANPTGRFRGALNCVRISDNAYHCGLAWVGAGYSYRASGRFWNFLQAGSVYLWYDVSGTRTSLSCKKAHPGAARCSSRFHWH
jgi:hypothetical protein